MELNEKLKAIREAKGLTRSEVEKKSGISYSCIKELENGSSNPTLFTLEVLCDCYGVYLWLVLNPGLSVTEIIDISVEIDLV